MLRSTTPLNLTAPTLLLALYKETSAALAAAGSPPLPLPARLLAAAMRTELAALGIDHATLAAPSPPSRTSVATEVRCRPRGGAKIGPR